MQIRITQRTRLLNTSSRNGTLHLYKVSVIFRQVVVAVNCNLHPNRCVQLEVNSEECLERAQRKSLQEVSCRSKEGQVIWAGRWHWCNASKCVM